MNADNLMSINCNRIDRNQFLDELTVMTAFSARQLAKYKFDICLANLSEWQFTGQRARLKNHQLQPICDPTRLQKSMCYTRCD